MTDSITPALSAEEWERLRAYTEANYSVFTGDWMLTAFLGMDRHDVRLAGLPERSTVDQAPHILMALANAALPNDDPRKITRADVRLLEDAAYTSRHHGGSEEVADAFDRIAAKLAALLPPE